MDDLALQIRPYAGRRDASRFADIRVHCADVDQYDPLSTLEQVPSATELDIEMTEASQNPDRAVGVVESDGVIVGYASVRSWQETDGVNVFLHSGFIDPRYRSRGFGTELLAWSEKTIRELAESKQIEEAIYGANASATEIDRMLLLEQRDYVPVLYLAELELTDFSLLQVFPIPANYAMRDAMPSDADALLKVNNEAYVGRKFVPIEEDSSEFRDALADRRYCITVIENDENIIGFAMSNVGPRRGEVEQLSILPEHRRQGLARAVLSHNLMQLHRRGQRNVRLHTDAEDVSGARSLYTSLGFVVLKTHSRYRKPLS